MTHRAGFPHSEIHGSKLAHSSPWLIAVCHVLHRLSVPRHPPNALQRLIVNYHHAQGQMHKRRLLRQNKTGTQQNRARINPVGQTRSVSNGPHQRNPEPPCLAGSDLQPIHDVKDPSEKAKCVSVLTAVWFGNLFKRISDFRIIPNDRSSIQRKLMRLIGHRFHRCDGRSARY